jgi:murein DD-endopeptidase MepM/ murein hydrolase activator NlpD
VLIGVLVVQVWLVSACTDTGSSSGSGVPGRPGVVVSLAPTSTATAINALTPSADPSSSPTPYAGDPTAPLPPPTRPDGSARYFADTGHYVRGDFLAFYEATPYAPTLFGLPLSEDFLQQLPDGHAYRVQYFERARFEYHPELPAGQRVQLGLLGAALLDGRSFDRLPPVASTATRLYFPETGHTISQGFLNYWRTNGGLRLFGLPLSEEMSEEGLTVQYFERARFEYHAELEGTPFAVQLSPVGYYALKAAGFNLPMGTLVRFNPPKLAEGHTAVVEVAISYGITVTGEYEGRPLAFKYDPQKGVAWAVLGATALGDTGPHAVTINLLNADGGRRTVRRTLEVVPYPFPSEALTFDPETARLLDPQLVSREQSRLDSIFAMRTPEQYWNGPFRMPLDGKITITSAFATRRCYNCPPGSRPTSYHGGMDMRAAEGTPVHAPAAGRVVLAERLAVRGNVVIIDHGMGVFSLFAHNSRLMVHVGQMVQAGDVISLSGNTGLSNGPHLHWELHVSGPGVDPLEWVRRAMP